MYALTVILFNVLVGFARFAESLNIQLDVEVLFQYANIILSALMPVILISAGFALGMFILKQIAGAFRRLGG